jgi:hypothetical protein
LVDPQVQNYAQTRMTLRGETPGRNWGKSISFGRNEANKPKGGFMLEYI